MQPPHTSGDGTDPADQWVLDPATGEYRLRLPGERAAAPLDPSDSPHTSSPSDAFGAPAPGHAAPAHPASTASEGAVDPQGRSHRRAAAQGGRSRRAPRGRNNRGWAVGVPVVLALALAGTVGYLTLGGGGRTDAKPSGAAPPSCSAAPAASPAASAPSGIPAGPKAQPINVRVTVLDGSGQFGSAETVLTWMQNTAGFLRTSNGGLTRQTATTSVVYAPDHADQARTLAAAMRLPASAFHATGKGTGLRDPMTLTLGRDFQGVGKPLARPSAPSTPTGCSPGALGG
ncbi:LytR C-terminal domain-containing protein [Streptomyces sp. ICBB 8177]|uniref:LytR C-terminal domain-containing protein n=1 Tax=Streptomyces sp. ICBB 8177 TaxID=563922 RepID=UPI000D67B449|nr:LytR C-terminal domain-containing protein [Streptomyces sp. ICBB 8177]PWI40941.1 transcriptional regulator [Streptomyces sp. ICBB 8177]